MDAAILQKAYSWAVEHGFDPRCEPKDISVTLSQPQANATVPAPYGQMHMQQQPALSRGVTPGLDLVRVTPESPPPAPSQQHGIILTIGSPSGYPTAVTTAGPVTPQPQQQQHSQQQQSQPPTVFESMLAGTVPCKPVYEDDLCGVVVDANPQAPLHLLIFPKQREGLERLRTITDAAHQRLLGHMLTVSRVGNEPWLYHHSSRHTGDITTLNVTPSAPVAADRALWLPRQRMPPSDQRRRRRWADRSPHRSAPVGWQAILLATGIIKQQSRIAQISDSETINVSPILEKEALNYRVEQ